MSGRFILLLLAIVAFSGCKKDPLTQPAQIYLDFGIIPCVSEDQKDASDDPLAGAPFSYIIDKGNLSVNSIEFDGRRQDASDVFFTVGYDPVLVVNLEDGTSSVAVNYDIPQGIYKKIELTFNLGGQDNLPLVLEGVYERNGEITPIRFEYEYSEGVRVSVKPSQGSQIVISMENDTRLKVEVDAGFLFRLINPGMINNADLVMIDGVETLLIDSSTNNGLFNMIAARIHQAFLVTVE